MMKRSAGGDFRGGGGGFRGGFQQKRGRFGGPFGGMPPQQQLEGVLELRILIPSKTAGAIIGRGGDTIKRLRSEFNCAVNVPDSNSGERILCVSGERESVLKCIREILPKILEGARSGPPPRPGENPQVDVGSLTTNEIRLLIHQSQAGAIIGRAGFKIKELREQSQCEIKVFTECCPGSTDRVVLVAGQNDRIVEALRKILEVCDEAPIKGAHRPYDTINYDPSFIFDYGGYPPDRPFGMGGGGGVGPRGGGFGGGGRGGFGRMPPPYGGGYGGGMGGMMDDWAADDGGMGGMMHPGMGRGGGAPFMGRRGGGASAFGGGDAGPYGMPPGMAGFGGGAGDDGGPVQTAQVTIPTELGGTIIGKGGERINRIRDDSGAVIEIEPPNVGVDERIITITGTTQQIQMAQYLLQRCVHVHKAGRGAKAF